MDKIRTREEMISEAYTNCMRELYERAQPTADYDNLVEEYRNGKIGPDERIYNRHYVSQEEYEYVVDKYVDIYGMKERWTDNVNTVLEWLETGGFPVDTYEQDELGRRGKKLNPPLKEALKGIVADASTSEDTKADLLYDTVKRYITECKNFYRFDREESEFKIALALGASPTSNPNTVKEWWKENYGEDVEIEERIPDLFWYYDNGYTDEDLAFEFENYGEDWKKKLYDEWQDNKRKRRGETLEQIEELNKDGNDKEKDTDNT